MVIYTNTAKVTASPENDFRINAFGSLQRMYTNVKNETARLQNTCQAAWCRYIRFENNKPQIPIDEVLTVSLLIKINVFSVEIV